MVYTDRALNHMSAPFKKVMLPLPLTRTRTRTRTRTLTLTLTLTPDPHQVMLDIGDMLKEVYHAENAVIIPGSGTYAMEAVARHFATNKKVMVLRNGYFSYRWTHIFETCAILALTLTVLLLPVNTHLRDVRHPAGACQGLRKGP